MVCRQLECGAAINASRGAHLGPGIGPIWFHHTYCNGQELVTTACTYPVLKDYRPEDLSHDRDAGVVCSGKSCLSGKRSTLRNASVSFQNVSEMMDYSL